MNSSGYGQRGAGEAPACVQNAMMTKDKKPFTYTPGGIDLSQIKSERMAKRLARNAQAEGATGASQQNRPQQPHSPSGSGGSAAATIGAAGMGMPFQVLPPPPPPAPMGAGKTMNGSAAPPPPPPPSSSNTSTLAPPINGGARAPGSPNAARKSPTPQRFEPPPMGCRPEIKIPPNPMAALRKVPVPVEKNTFWKDEYVKDRSKSPMVGEGDSAETDYGHDEGYKRPTPAPTTAQKPETNAYNSNNNTNQNNQQYAPQAQQPQQYHQAQQYNSPPPPAAPTPAVGQQQSSPRPEFRSVAAPQSPSVNVYTRQSDSPLADAVDSAPRYAPQQQQQQAVHQQPRSPLAQPQPQQQQHVSPATTAAAGAGSAQAQTVPWRTQRGQQPQTQQQQQQQAQQQHQQSHPQPIFNNVQQQQQSLYQAQQQRSPELSTPQSYGAQNQLQQIQGTKPTNVGSLYIAPLAAPVEPQAQQIVRQQMQQQQQRDSPMRQAAPPQQQQQQQQPRLPTARWMNSQAPAKEQPEWAHPEENGNVVPSSLNRIKSPPPPAMASVQLQYQQPSMQGGNNNGFAPMPSMQNFGTQMTAPTGLRLQINTSSGANPSNGPKERIIPIQLEQTPTYTPPQPNFTAQSPYGVGNGNNGSTSAQPNKFTQQRPAFNNNDFPQQYVHPSEQQVPEPKKYTGSAIPSRSFKILQAMTTPENAGPGQSDL